MKEPTKQQVIRAIVVIWGLCGMVAGIAGLASLKAHNEVIKTTTQGVYND